MSDHVSHLGNFALQTSSAFLLLPFSMFAAAPTALAEDPALLVAQAGSTGGTLGKEEKSVSGGEQTYAPKKIPKAASAHRRPHSAPPAKTITASLAIFDGTWAGVEHGPLHSPLDLVTASRQWGAGWRQRLEPNRTGQSKRRLNGSHGRLWLQL